MMARAVEARVLQERSPPAPTGTMLRSLPPWLAPAALLAVSAAGALLFWVALRSVDLGQLGDIGLAALLPPHAFVGLALLAAAFTGTLALGRERPALLVWHLVVLVGVLHATVAWVEEVSRFETAWIHAGFVDYVVRTGGTLPDLDARWSWPGFFALSAFAAQVAGADGVVGALRWAPTVSNLAYLLPLLVIARRMTTTWRARWLAAWLFVAANWVGQDYYSPQGLAVLFYLTFLAIVLSWFRPLPNGEPGEGDLLGRAQATGARVAAVAGRRLLGRLGRLVAAALPGLRRAQVRTPPERAGLLLVLLVLFAAVTVSHQLTPFAIIAAVAALVLVGQSSLRGLPLSLGVMVAAWVSWMAGAYWTGHLDNITGGVGSIFSNFGDNVGDRITGTPERQLLQLGRMAFTVTAWGLAAVGVLRRLRAGIADWAVALLAVTPLSVVAVQSYGGEALFRVHFFALPFLALLGALAFFPSRSPRRPVTALVATFVAGCLLLPGFFLARYGNEAFERFTPGEVAAMEYVYDHLPEGTGAVSVVSIAPNSLPAPAQDVERIRMVPALGAGEQAKLDLEGVYRLMLERHAEPDTDGVMLVLSRVQRAFTQANLGQPAAWVADLEQRVSQSDLFRVVYANDTAAVLTLAEPPPPADAAAPEEAGG